MSHNDNVRAQLHEKKQQEARELLQSGKVLSTAAWRRAKRQSTATLEKMDECKRAKKQRQLVNQKLKGILEQLMPIFRKRLGLDATGSSQWSAGWETSGWSEAALDIKTGWATGSSEAASSKKTSQSRWAQDASASQVGWSKDSWKDNSSSSSSGARNVKPESGWSQVLDASASKSWKVEGWSQDSWTGRDSSKTSSSAETRKESVWCLDSWPDDRKI